MSSSITQSLCTKTSVCTVLCNYSFLISESCKSANREKNSIKSNRSQIISLPFLVRSLSLDFQSAEFTVSNLLTNNKRVSLCHTFSVSVFQQWDSLQPAPPADGCLDMMPPAQLLRKNLRAQTSPAERQTENKVTAETQAVLNITKPPAAHTTQLNTSTWKRWWLFLGPYG